jgi:predicted PurR-regulated permease PerM
MKSYSSVLNTLLVIVIIVASLFLAREVLLPITLAAILSFMLAPLVRALQNLRLPRELAAVSVVLTAFAAIFALGTITARQVTELAGNLPHYQATISAKIQRFSGIGEEGTAGTLKRAEDGDADKCAYAPQRIWEPRVTVRPWSFRLHPLLLLDEPERSGGPACSTF